MRVHMHLEFHVDAQLNISLNYIGVTAIGLLYLIFCHELAVTWLRMADNLIAVAAIRFLRYLLLATGMTPIPILVIT